MMDDILSATDTFQEKLHHKQATRSKQVGLYLRFGMDHFRSEVC